MVFVQTQLIGDRSGYRLGVAGEHHGLADACGLQAPDGLRAVGLDHVRDEQITGVLILDGHMHEGARLGHFGGGEAQFCHQAGVAGGNGFAVHLCCHAVAAKYLAHVDPVHHITIIPRGGAGGMTIFRPQEDKSFKSRSEMFEQIVMALGGRMAEKLFLDDISTGASGDIQQATSIARNMVTVYGMSDRLGPISFDSSEHSIFIGRDFGQTKSYSEETAAIIDEEVKRLFDDAAQKCEEILLAHADVLRATAEYLLEHETMDGADFIYLCEHGTLPGKAQAGAAAEPQSEPSVPDMPTAGVPESGVSAPEDNDDRL